MDLNWTLIAVVAAINFAAALLQASCGFGYAMLAMTLMPLVLPMQTCSAGKESITVGYMAYIIFCSTSCHDCTRTAILPNINIFLCIESNYSTTCCTTCRLHSHTFR